MKVKFTEPGDTLKYGPVAAGDIIDVSTADGVAFIANGVATDPETPLPSAPSFAPAGDEGADHV